MWRFAATPFRSCAADASTSGEGWDLRQMPHPLHLHHEQCRPDCSESHQGSHFRIEASFLWDEEQAISAGIAIIPETTAYYQANLT